MENIELDFSGMGVFQEAREREKAGYGWRASRAKMLWESKTCAWNWLAIYWGIRWSDINQIFPIWNMSDNGNRSLLFGIGKFYFQISYHRAKSYNQFRSLPLEKVRTVRRLYQLFF